MFLNLIKVLRVITFGINVIKVCNVTKVLLNMKRQRDKYIRFNSLIFALIIQEQEGKNVSRGSRLHCTLNSQKSLK